MDNYRGQETVQELRKVVQQLELEAKIDRIPLSQAARTLIVYCESNCNDDPLLTGIPASMNPFKEKKSCTLI